MQGEHTLHWPLINSDHMRSKLAKRELEKKRIEDDHRYPAFPSGVFDCSLFERSSSLKQGAIKNS